MSSPLRPQVRKCFTCGKIASCYGGKVDPNVDNGGFAWICVLCIDADEKKAHATAHARRKLEQD